MKVLSVFSGIGGLEHPTIEPEVVCDRDPASQLVLKHRYPQAGLVEDIRMLHPGRFDLVLGGWPCQDLSIAGRLHGLKGQNSSLFYELVRVAAESGAETLIAENVPHILRMKSGTIFQEVLKSLHLAGFETVSWRTINARAFGLPHQRRRVFIVASRNPTAAWALHREIPNIHPADGDRSNSLAAAFYWTAGTRSISFSKGFAPTLKVGSSISIPSPIGIFVNNQVRRASGAESLALQGFSIRELPELNEADALRLAGNAVAQPVGKFAAESATIAELPEQPAITSFGAITAHGVSEIRGSLFGLSHSENSLASNLHEFLQPSGKRLGARAAAGLIRRLRRSGQKCPEELLSALHAEANNDSLDPRARQTKRSNRAPEAPGNSSQLFVA